jgi:HK97 gp10 family phage protein
MASNSIEAQLRQIVAEMKAYEQRVQQVAATTLAEHAGQVAADARALAPVDTGELRDSIQVVKTDDLHYQVEATAPYAAAVELGTVHQAAEPFLFPAFEASRNELPRKLAAALKRG